MSSLPPIELDTALKEFTVAHGRSVKSDDGHKGPGKTVLLTEEEAERLFKLGFILGEDGSQTALADGPAVNVENGMQIKPKG